MIDYGSNRADQGVMHNWHGKSSNRCWNLPAKINFLQAPGVFPPAAEAFRQEILEADSTLVASPEHNYPVFDTVSFHEVLSIYE